VSALTQTRDHARSMAKRGGGDQALWTQIADEIDEYLAGPPVALDLFGDETTEPEIPRALCDPLPVGADIPDVRTFADPEPE
jgi:hypothetical protein